MKMAMTQFWRGNTLLVHIILEVDLPGWELFSKGCSHPNNVEIFKGAPSSICKSSKGELHNNKETLKGKAVTQRCKNLCLGTAPQWFKSFSKWKSPQAMQILSLHGKAWGALRVSSLKWQEVFSWKHVLNGIFQNWCCMYNPTTVGYLEGGEAFEFPRRILVMSLSGSEATLR